MLIAAASATAKISVVDLWYSFESARSKVDTLRGVSFECWDGELLSIVGPSGCGKSTLLSIVAGLRAPASGGVYLNGKPVTGPPPGIGVIFQRNTLLPWRTVKENVELGLELSGVERSERESIALGLIERYGLAGFERKYPHALSGGMQKRVALIQTLACNPDILLLDEAFSSLDAQTRVVVEDEFVKIARETRKTVISITHDITEAICMSDRVIVLTARPCRVKGNHIIRFDKVPTSILDIPAMPEFPAYYRAIWDELEVAGVLLI